MTILSTPFESDSETESYDYDSGLEGEAVRDVNLSVPVDAYEYCDKFTPNRKFT